mmetsp:Transcript_58500/g.137400  ORF Transcript_58500/g.137400 Transcript_58500/m.137400 type:complete len:206 (+) Transcript_58500:408-1025(+)
MTRSFATAAYHKCSTSSIPKWTCVRHVHLGWPVQMAMLAFFRPWMVPNGIKITGFTGCAAARADTVSSTALKSYKSACPVQRAPSVIKMSVLPVSHAPQDISRKLLEAGDVLHARRTRSTLKLVRFLCLLARNAEAVPSRGVRGRRQRPNATVMTLSTRARSLHLHAHLALMGHSARMVGVLSTGKIAHARKEILWDCGCRPHLV